MNAFAPDTFARGQKTANAGTIITTFIPPRGDKKTKITDVRYTQGATQHAITFLRPIGKTTVVSAVAGGGTVVTLAADPGAWGTTNQSVSANPLAANDYIFVRLADYKTWRLILVTSVAAAAADGSIAVTIPALPTNCGIRAGEIVWDFGITTDSEPNTGEAHPVLKGTVSVTNTWGVGDGLPLIQTYNVNEPIMIHSDNATNQGYLEQVTAVYL